MKTVSSVTFDQELEKRRACAEEIIRAYLPGEKETRGRLAEAMNYSMLAGGKRIRPILMLEAYRICGGGGTIVRPFAAAIEMIHTSSLIHDDLPAIDNDGFRRGRRTTHAVFGYALGILSGDALENYAYETALKAFSMTEGEQDISRIAEALRVLADKTGIHGMLGGQSLDVENEKNRVFQLDREPLDYIYLNKTAALLEAPLMIGAILAGGGEDVVSRMEQIGQKAGLAFQIEDDILDVTATTEQIGKPAGSDEKNDKTTYVTLYGVEESRRIVDRLTEEAETALDGIPGDTEFLRKFLRKLAKREK